MSKEQIDNLLAQGNAALISENVQAAEAFFSEAVEIDPGNPETYKNIGNYYLCHYDASDESSALDTAESYYKLALEHDQNYWAPWHNLGNVYVSQRSSLIGKLSTGESAKILLDKAIQHYNHALTIAPDSHLTYYCLGQLYHSIRKFDLAESNYRKAIEFNNKQKAYYEMLGEVLTDQGKTDEAIPLIERLMQEAEDIENRQELALLIMKAYCRADEHHKAIQILESNFPLENKLTAVFDGKFKLNNLYDAVLQLAYLYQNLEDYPTRLNIA